jgi:hypothetical protein
MLIFDSNIRRTSFALSSVLCTSRKLVKENMFCSTSCDCAVVLKRERKPTAPSGPARRFGCCLGLSVTAKKYLVFSLNNSSKKLIYHLQDSLHQSQITMWVASEAAKGLPRKSRSSSCVDVPEFTVAASIWSLISSSPFTIIQKELPVTTSREWYTAV